MDYSQYIKKLQLPLGVSVPTDLRYEDLAARPLTRQDLAADMQAVNSSLQLIRDTRGGSWPQEAVSEGFDFLDLAWHEREFRDGNSYAYVVYDQTDTYIGCFYLYGIGIRTALSDQTKDFEVDASWWVTTDAYERGYYQKLRLALRTWLSDSFQFGRVYYSNKEQ